MEGKFTPVVAFRQQHGPRKLAHSPFRSSSHAKLISAALCNFEQTSPEALCQSARIVPGVSFQEKLWAFLRATAGAAPPEVHPSPHKGAAPLTLNPGTSMISKSQEETEVSERLEEKALEAEMVRLV
jgi:hypothetical protein